MCALHRGYGFLLLPVLFCAHVCWAQSACRNETTPCDTSVDYFGLNSTQIKWAGNTLKDLKFENTFVTFTSIGTDGSEYKQMIVKCGCQVGDQDPDVQVMFTNPTNVYVSDGPVIAMMDRLGLLDRIKFVGTAKFVVNPNVQKQLEDGKTFELGSPTNYTKLSEDKENTGVSIIGSFEFSVQSYDDEDVGIPRLVISEQNENDPLGRAEWMKVLGLLFEKGPEATDIFNAIESDYEEIKKKAAAASRRPSVFFRYPTLRVFDDYDKDRSPDENFVWRQPHKGTYISALVADANADYFFQLVDAEEDHLLNFTDIRRDFASAQFIVNVDPFPVKGGFDLDGFINSPLSDVTPAAKRDTSFRDLSKELAAVRCGNVYSNQAIVTNSGANDFLERAIVEPDVVLRDYVKMFHPNIELEDFEYSFRLKGNPSELTGEKCPYNDLTKEAEEKDKKLGTRRLIAPKLSRFALENKMFKNETIKTDLGQVLEIDEDDIDFVFTDPNEDGNNTKFTLRAVLDDPEDIEKDEVLQSLRKTVAGDIRLDEDGGGSNGPDEEEDGGGLSGGAIVGIVLAVLVVLGVLLFCCYRRSKQGRTRIPSAAVGGIDAEQDANWAEI